ncbi:MAG: carbon storage regulator CsrA [Peptococcaceae bacterium]|nr:carbon storage regulator CsrA [Candidatus Syntrophopropionicum ammoniitolerans]
MLVLARKKGQAIMIGRDIKILVVEVTGETVRLGIEAPVEMDIFREELYLDLQKENTGAITSAAEVMQFLQKTSREKK